jgi:hypothetical protein
VRRSLTLALLRRMLLGSLLPQNYDLLFGEGAWQITNNASTCSATSWM